MATADDESGARYLIHQPDCRLDLGPIEMTTGAGVGTRRQRQWREPTRRRDMGQRLWVRAVLATLPALLLLQVFPGAPSADASGRIWTTDFPDPTIVRDGDTYYAYGTITGAPGIPVQKIPVLTSTDLRTWTHAGDALGNVASWSTVRDLWAPGVVKLSSGWRLYYTAPHVASGKQCISVATASGPVGPFQDSTPVPLVCQIELNGSIDPSPFIDTDGTAWLTWKSEGDPNGEETRIWVQRLTADGLSLTGPRSQLIQRDQSWERPLVENPAMILHQGRYLLFYSASDWNTSRYGIGYAVCESVMGPCTKPRTSALLASSGDAAGPGGAAPFLDVKGNLQLGFHAWTSPRIGYENGGARTLRIKPVLGSGSDLSMPDGSPFGAVDEIQDVVGGLRVRGWSLDPDTTEPLTVHAYVDDVLVASAVSGIERADVGSAFGTTSSRGFEVVAPAQGGWHNVCLYAINKAFGGNSFLGCRVGLVAWNPYGSVDAATSAPGGFRLAGWSIDPETTEPIGVHVYLDGRLVAATNAGVERLDVAAAKANAGPAHGFDTAVPAGPGFHTVCAYAINVSKGENGMIGCRWVVVSNDPMGSLDSAVATPDGVRVSGWAIDPDVGPPIDVHFYLDGQGVGITTAAAPRADLAGAFPAFGPNHGFDALVPGSPGQTLCAYGINAGAGESSLVGCRRIAAD